MSPTNRRPLGIGLGLTLLAISVLVAIAALVPTMSLEVGDQISFGSYLWHSIFGPIECTGEMIVSGSAATPRIAECVAIP